MKIFSVIISPNRKKEVLESCLRQMQSESKNPLFLATLNPEILLKARKDKKYQKILNSAKIKLIDGFGIKLLSWLKKEQVGDRITGADLAESLIKIAEESNLKTGIIYNENGLSSRQEIEKSLVNFKKIILCGMKKNNTQFNDLKLLENCQLILVATGFPYQEELIYNELLKLPNLKIAMGIGGTLDFWTKKKLRAPEIIRAIGFEWLWRLLIQPNRIFRILRAVVIFPFFVLIENNDKSRN